MPFRDTEHRAKIQFQAAPETPSQIYAACQVTGHASMTRYVQYAVCAALARDLGLDYETLIAHLPPTRTDSTGMRTHRRPGAGNTIEEVR